MLLTTNYLQYVDVEEIFSKSGKKYPGGTF